MNISAAIAAQAAQGNPNDNPITSIPSCIPDVISCNTKMLIIVVEMVWLLCAYYFSSRPEKKFILFGKERTYEWAFLQLVAIWPIVCVIIIGFMTLSVKPLT